MTQLDASTDEIVVELARRLRTPEPLMRTRIGLSSRGAVTPVLTSEARSYAEDGWSWAGNDS